MYTIQHHGEHYLSLEESTSGACKVRTYTRICEDAGLVREDVQSHSDPSLGSANTYEVCLLVSVRAKPTAVGREFEGMD